MNQSIDAVTIQCLREHVTKLEVKLRDAQTLAHKRDLDMQTFECRAKKAEAMLTKLNVLPPTYLHLQAAT